MKDNGKALRLIAAWTVLLNCIFFFCPLTVYSHKNYPTRFWTEMEYVLRMQRSDEPYLYIYQTERLGWIAVFILLPLLLSLISFIWTIATGGEKKGGMIPVFIIFALYIGLVISLDNYLPNPDYSRAASGILHLIATGISALFAMIGLAIKPEEIEEPEFAPLSNVGAVKQQQVEQRYKVMVQGNIGQSNASVNPAANTAPQNMPQGSNMQQIPSQPMQQNLQQDSTAVQGNVMQQSQQPAPVAPKKEEMIEVPPYVPGNPKGMIVGLKGLYRGAQIQLQPDEYITIGRGATSHLVYPNEPEYKRISRNHCSIKWDAGHSVFLFKDTSSRGSYANGGQDCLPQNMEIQLPPGTILSLADDEKNIFRLE